MVNMNKFLRITVWNKNLWLEMVQVVNFLQSYAICDLLRTGRRLQFVVNGCHFWAGRLRCGGLLAGDGGVGAAVRGAGMLTLAIPAAAGGSEPLLLRAV